MSHAINSESGSAVDRRTGNLDRRLNGERRNKDRLLHMKGECRSNVPRRNSDVAGRLVEGELWWSGH